MVKWFGALLIMAAGSGLGWWYARRLFRRAEWLGGLATLLDVLTDRLAFSAAPLGALWADLAAGERTARLPLVQAVAADLREGVSFEAAFSRAVTEAQRAGWLLAAETEALHTLAALLGRSGLSEQAQHIARCRDSVLRTRTAALSSAAVRAPVYRMTGFAGGVSLALLLL